MVKRKKCYLLRLLTTFITPPRLYLRFNSYICSGKTNRLATNVNNHSEIIIIL